MFLLELVGKRGFTFLQNSPGCLALKEVSQQKVFKALRFSDVTLLRCRLLSYVSIICFGAKFHAAIQVISMATGRPESTLSLGARAVPEHL